MPPVELGVTMSQALEGVSAACWVHFGKRDQDLEDLAIGHR